MADPERRLVTVERLISGPVEEIFKVLATPARHAEIDGSGMLIGDPHGPTRLSPGAGFTMAMTQGADLNCGSVNTVVEFEEPYLIAWETRGLWRDVVTVGGQRWRYRLTPRRGETLVRHSYVWGYARWPLLTIALPRYPSRMQRAMQLTLDRLAVLIGQVG